MTEEATCCWKKADEFPMPKGECLVWGPEIGFRVFHSVGRDRAGYFKAVPERFAAWVWTKECPDIELWMPIPLLPKTLVLQEVKKMLETMMSFLELLVKE